MWEELSTSIHSQLHIVRPNNLGGTTTPYMISTSISDEHLGHIFETFITVVARSVCWSLPKEPAGSTVTYLIFEHARFEVRNQANLTPHNSNVFRMGVLGPDYVRSAVENKIARQ